MLRLKDMKNISLSVYDAVEAWYVRENELRHHKSAWIRKAIYYSYLTGHLPSELFNSPSPKLSLERHRIGKDLMGFVKLESVPAIRNSRKLGIKTFYIPIFLDFSLDKSANKTLFVEEEMWSIITDSWAYAPYTLHLDFGNFPMASLKQRIKAVKIRAHTPEVKDVSLKLSDLRTLRIYDLLVNRIEYLAGNPQAVANIVGLKNMHWLCESDVYRFACKTSNLGDALSIIKKYGSEAYSSP